MRGFRVIVRGESPLQTIAAWSCFHIFQSFLTILGVMPPLGAQQVGLSVNRVNALPVFRNPLAIAQLRWQDVQINLQTNRLAFDGKGPRNNNLPFGRPSS